MTAELQRRLQDSRGIIATSVSPGFVSSNIFTSVPPSLAWLLQGLASVVGRTPAQVGSVARGAANMHAVLLHARTEAPLPRCWFSRPAPLHTWPGRARVRARSDKPRADGVGAGAAVSA